MQNDRLAWPISLLLLTVLVPSLGVVWMMREAVRNEQLATSQRLREAYQAQLKSASQSVQERWAAQLELLAQQVDEQDPAHSFAEIISRQFFDSVLICDSQGQVIYPTQSMLNNPALIDFGPEWHRAESFEFTEQQYAIAAKAYAQIVLEHPNAVVRARSQQAQVRCLLKMGELNSAINVLEAQCRQGEVYDAQGRSFAATAALRLLELLEPESQSWNEIFERLARQLGDYQGVTLASSQRLFLMTELQRLSSQTIKWPTQAAETLAMEVASKYEPSFASLSLQQVSIPDLWAQASLDGRVVGIYHTAAIREQLLKLTEGLPLPSGVKYIVTEPEKTVPSLMDISLGETLGRWRLNLSATGGDPFDESSQQRQIVHIWIALMVVSVTFLLAWILATALRRRLQLAQLKNDLVATVSHELKTPLASIRLLVDTLLETDCNPTDKKSQTQVREYLELISHENSRLTRLIDNFLTFSQMEGSMQRFNFQVIDMRDVILQATAIFREHFSDIGSCLHVDKGEPVCVSGDLDALVTAVVNLLENAWKYSGEHKQIWVTTSTDGDQVLISVRDNGIGLNAHAASRVFDRFYQVDQRVARTQGGCGLGLSIVKGIMQSHGGDVRVESQPGKGSTFTLSVPKLSKESINTSQPMEHENQR